MGRLRMEEENEEDEEVRLRGREGGVALVGGGVVDVIEGGYNAELLAAELAFEGAEVIPGMIGLIFRANAPKVIPLMTEGFGFAHDFEVEEIRRHYVAMLIERSAIEIGGGLAEKHDQGGSQPAARILGEKERTVAGRRKIGEQGLEVIRGF